VALDHRVLASSVKAASQVDDSLPKSGSPALEIRVSDEDVQIYVVDYISKSKSKVVKEYGEEIKVGIKDTVEGMYVPR
jgi:hypothetical protein